MHAQESMLLNNRQLTHGHLTPRLSCGARAPQRLRPRPPARRLLQPVVRPSLPIATRSAGRNARKEAHRVPEMLAPAFTTGFGHASLHTQSAPISPRATENTVLTRSRGPAQSPSRVLSNLATNSIGNPTIAQMAVRVAGKTTR